MMGHNRFPAGIVNQAWVDMEAGEGLVETGTSNAKTGWGKIALAIPAIDHDSGNAVVANKEIRRRFSKLSSQDLAAARWMIGDADVADGQKPYLLVQFMMKTGAYENITTPQSFRAKVMAAAKKQVVDAYKAADGDHGNRYLFL